MIRKKVSVFTACAVLLYPVASQSEPVMFKQFALGSDRETIIGQIGSLQCDLGGKPWPSDVVQDAIECMPERDNGGIKLTDDVDAALRFDFIGDKVVAIGTYENDEAEGIIRESLIGKFGQPKSETHGTVQVATGATFPQVVTTWETPTATITMKVPDHLIHRMSAVYVDKALAAQAHAQHKPAQVM